MAPAAFRGCGCPVDTSAEGRSTDRAGRRDSGDIDACYIIIKGANQMNQQVRNGKIDLLKFIFSIIVVIYHFNVGNYHYTLFIKGYVAVEFFFVT